MGIFTSRIETKIKLVRIVPERNEAILEITKTLHDGGLTLEGPYVVIRALREGQELTTD